MDQEHKQIVLAEAGNDIRKRAKEIGADESIDTAVAFLIVAKLGDAMRRSYSKSKKDSLSELVSLSHSLQQEQHSRAAGMLIDAFIVGWIGQNKIK